MVARALVQEPRLLVLDEPTNHLDIRHQPEVLALIRDLPLTIVISLHDLNMAAGTCDEVLLLQAGRAHRLRATRCRPVGGQGLGRLPRERQSGTPGPERYRTPDVPSPACRNPPVKHLVVPRLVVPCLVALAVGAGDAVAETTVQSCDRTVTFDAPPERAIAHDVNLIEMMLVLGLADSMVGYTGVSGWKTLDEEMRAGVEALPELAEKYPSKEVLVGADADFFFAGWNYGMKVGGEVTPETLAPFGIAVYELTESCTHVMEGQGQHRGHVRRPDQPRGRSSASRSGPPPWWRATRQSSPRSPRIPARTMRVKMTVICSTQ